MTRRPATRPGAVVPMVALLMVFLLGMVAFAVDIGYICVVQKELQNAADAAALAGTSQLLDRGLLTGNPNLSATVSNARDKAQELSAANMGGGVSLTLSRNSANDADGDIVCGYIADPTNFNSTLNRSASRFNSVRVRVRRNGQQNGALQLFFGPILGKGTQDLVATATATYEDGIRGFSTTGSGATNSKLLPFTLKVDAWNAAINGSGPDEWYYNPATGSYSPGSDGVKEISLFPTKGNAPGNFGTLDIGVDSNSNDTAARQVLYGPDAADFAAMGGEFALGDNGTKVVQGDTGISAGFKEELEAIRGQKRIIPLYSTVTGQGNNTYFTIVGFGGVTVLDVKLSTGNKFLTIQPEYCQDPTALPGGTSTTAYFVTKPLRITR